MQLVARLINLMGQTETHIYANATNTQHSWDCTGCPASGQAWPPTANADEASHHASRCRSIPLAKDES